MRKAVLIQSLHLLDQEGKGDSTAYKNSGHGKSLSLLRKALEAFQITYEQWDESDLNKLGPVAPSDKWVFIVPGARVFAESAFQKLLWLAEQGHTVFGFVDSFYYDRTPDGKADRVLANRIRGAFQLAPSTAAESVVLTDAQVRFAGGQFGWLTEGLPALHAWNRKTVLAVQDGQSPVFRHYGSIAGNETKKDAQGNDTQVARVVPAFLIRPYEGGGMFIYGCYAVDQLPEHKRIFRNLVNYNPTNQARISSDSVRGLHVKLRVARIMNIVLGALFFLLLAKEVIGDSYGAYLGGALSGVLIGILSNKLTDWLNRYAS